MGFLKSISRFFRKLSVALVGFVLGLSCTLLFYEFVLCETDFDDSYKVLMFLSTGIFLAFGFGFSRQIRCITILTIPEFMTKSGRRAIQATILILMIAGPMHNIGDNGEETVRFLGCIKDMLLEILIAGKDLVLAPIQHILFDINTNEVEEPAETKYNLTMLKELMRPIILEVEGQAETDDLKYENDYMDTQMGFTIRSVEVENRYKAHPSDSKSNQVEESYKKKLAYRCEEVFTKGTSKCVEMFQDKYNECYETVTVVLGWALCWPMKLHFICNILNVFSQSKVCDMTDVVEKGFGKSYSVALKGIDDFGQSFNVHVNYQGLSEMINLDGLKAAQKDLLMYYLESEKYVDWYLTIVKRLLALSYLLVVFGAVEYHRNYFERLSFDNIYITKYFKKIDDRRRESEKSYLFPLKSFESSDFSRLKRIKLSEQEWMKFGQQLFAISIQAGFVLTIFGFDFVFTELLRLVQNHADMHIHQVGQHVLGIEVKGEGLLAQLLRIVIRDFNISKTIDISHLTSPCLPKPRTTPKAYYQRVLLLFCVLLINSYFEAHCIRFRHCVANYFYPKRSRKRTIWLYNETLKKRKSKMSHLKRRVLENADKFRMFVPRNPLVLLAELFPRRCRCLRKWKIARRKCVVCKRNGEIYRCPQCGFSYCQECFLDLDERCLYCIAAKEVQFKLDSNSESETVV